MTDYKRFVTIRDTTRQRIVDYFESHSIPYEERLSPDKTLGCETVLYYSLKGTDVTDNVFATWLQENGRY